MDAPYAKGLSQKVLHELITKNWLQEKALCIVEIRADEQIEITIVKNIAKDTEHKVEVDGTKNIKLDLNGFTFTTMASDYVITNYGQLEIYDSSEVVDEETGEISKKRKSPKTGTLYDAYYELYKIKPYLTHPNLHLCFVLIDAEEYRLLNGWSHDRKKGSSRYDRIPTQLVQEVEINRIEDYMQFVPYELDSDFTVKDFAKSAHIPVRPADPGRSGGSRL